MNKRQVRVFVDYAAFNGKYNHEIFLISHDGYGLSLAVCVTCGTLFVIDWENPATAGLSLDDFAKGQTCPQCQGAMSETLKSYPSVFITKDGSIASYTDTHHIPEKLETRILELWELLPPA